MAFRPYTHPPGLRCARESRAEDGVRGMADVYIGAQIGWGLQFGTMEARPGFQRYVERCNSRPACVRATKLDDALMPAHD